MDHYYTNTINSVKNIGLLVTDISDHLPIIATVTMQVKKVTISDPYPYVRDFKNFDSDEFNNSISNFTDDRLLSLDSRFQNLNCHILSCINAHIPLRKRTEKEKKFAMKPWISNNLKRSIKERKRLYNLSRKNHPEKRLRVKKYNKYKKTLEKALFAAENQLILQR